MSIKLPLTSDNIALIKAMASKDKSIAAEAQAKLSTTMQPTLEKVMDQSRTLSAVFKAFPYAPESNPSLPLDLYHDHTIEDEIRVWSQATPGGLATNHMEPITQEVKFKTFTLDSAVSFDIKHAKQGNLGVVAKSFNRLAQTFLIKEENIAVKILLKVLADNYASNVVTTSAAQVIQPEDFNSLLLQASRIYTSWAGGTTADSSQTVTDLFLSPERMKDLRAMAYNPVNSKGSNQTTGTANSGVVAAPDAFRASLFGASGLSEFYGITLHQLLELGPSKKFSLAYIELAAAAGATTASGDDLVIGFDMTKEFAFRAISTNPDDAGATVNLMPDDQFLVRQKKIGFYGEEELGYMVLDSRPIVGLRVKAS